MFAQHLRISRRLSTEPVFAPGDVGDYQIAPGYDRRALLSGSTLRLYGDLSTNTRQGVSYASAAGMIGVSDRYAVFPGGGNQIHLYRAGSSGLGALLASYPKIAREGTSYIAGPLLVFIVISNNTDFLVTVKDLATGETGPATVYPGFASQPILSSGDDVYFPTGPTNPVRDPRTFLNPGSGRAARCRIAGGLYESAPYPLIHRQSVGGLLPVYMTPFRRPMTTATFARHYDVTQSPGSFVRRAKLYRRATVRTYEIEVGPSLAIVDSGGVRYSRHDVSVYAGTGYGCLRFSGGSVEFLRLGDAMRSGTMQCLQYLGAGDVPTGEFIIESLGRWLPNDGLALTVSGQAIVPSCVTMNNIVQPNAALDRLEVFDLDGNYLETTSPPGVQIGSDWDVNGANAADVINAFFHVQNRDMIVFSGAGFGAAVPATVDCGRTWFNLTIATANDQPGYAPLPIPAGAADQRRLLRAITSWRPLFVT